MIKIERTKKNEIESEWIAIKRNLYIKKVKTKKKNEMKIKVDDNVHVHIFR